MRKPQPPLPLDPIEPGRLVTYRGDNGLVQGWNPDHAVLHCRWKDGLWLIELLDGTEIYLSDILAVAEVDREGQVIAHWTTHPLWTEEEYTREAIN